MKRNVLWLSVATLFASTPVAANELVTGSSSNLDVSLSSAANWTTIRSATVVINHTAVHGCVATASADMAHAGAEGLENQYRFVLARNNSNPVTNTGSERILELINNSGVNDPNSKPVATTQHFTGLTSTNGTNGTGSHTFYFLGRKVEAADATAPVLDASLSVICVHTP